MQVYKQHVPYASVKNLEPHRKEGHSTTRHVQGLAKPPPAASGLMPEVIHIMSQCHRRARRGWADEAPVDSVRCVAYHSRHARRRCHHHRQQQREQHEGRATQRLHQTRSGFPKKPAQNPIGFSQKAHIVFIKDCVAPTPHTLSLVGITRWLQLFLGLPRTPRIRARYTWRGMSPKALSELRVEDARGVGRVRTRVDGYLGRGQPLAVELGGVAVAAVAAGTEDTADMPAAPPLGASDPRAVCTLSHRKSASAL